MKLYFRPGACALAPHILLEHVGIAYEAVHAPSPDKFRDINPNGAVPVLELSEGKRVTQCGAILQFICEVSDRAELLGGQDHYQRAIVAKWTSFFTGDFHPAFFPIFAPQRYTTSADAQSLAEVKAAGRTLVQNGLAEIESRLTEHEFLAGDQHTIADFYAVPMLRWCKSLFQHELTDWPSTHAFYERMTLLEATKRALTTQKISA